VATARAAVELVRQGLAALQRRYAAKAALAAQVDPSAARARERIDEFAASLPPPASRLRPLWMAAGVLVIAELLLPLVSAVSSGLLPNTVRGGHKVGEVATALRRVADLSANNVGDAINLMLRTNLLVTGLILVTVGFAVYLVLRPLANGAIELALLRDGAAARRWPPFDARERRAGSLLSIRERERDAFGAAGLNAPLGSTVDLVAKACVVVPLLLVAAGFWSVYASKGSRQVQYAGNIAPGFGERGDQEFVIHMGAAKHAWIAAAAAVIAIMRLVWLALAGRRRDVARRTSRMQADEPSRVSRARRAALAFALPVTLAAAGVVLYAHWDHAPPDVWSSMRKLAAARYQIVFSCSEYCEADLARLVNKDPRGPRPPTWDGAPPAPELGYGPGWTEPSGDGTLPKRWIASFLKRSSSAQNADAPEYRYWRPAKPLQVQPADLSPAQLRWLRHTAAKDPLGNEWLAVRVSDKPGKCHRPRVRARGVPDVSLSGAGSSSGPR
jgi:hypothetical protein